MISYSYPTLQQAEEAGLDLVPRLIGQQPKNVPAMVQDCYALIGYGLKIAALNGGLPITRPDSDQFTDPDLAEALHPLYGAPSATLPPVDWKAVLKLALQFLLQVLGCVVLLLAFSASAQADEHQINAHAAVAVALAQRKNDCDPPCNDYSCKCLNKGDCLCGSACFCENCAGKKPRSTWQEWHNGWWRDTATGWWWHAQIGYSESAYVQPWPACQPGLPAISPFNARNTVGPSCRQ
jgi:hypothetical protein